MRKDQQQAATQIDALYDGKCPICLAGIENYALGTDHGTLNPVDARKSSDLKREALARGFNLDRSIMIRHEGQFYEGGDALNVMAKLADQRSLINRLFSWVFRSRALSRFLYPFLRSVRLGLLRMKNIPKISEDIQTIHDEDNKKSTIQRLLGQDWQTLHPNIQKRFRAEPAIGEKVVYQGKMEVIQRSFAGMLFAQLTRVIGNPLSPYAGQDVKMDVTLYRKPTSVGVYWKRTYHYQGRKPYMVVSEKREDANGSLVECIAAGFGMVLKVEVHDGNLHFRSTEYFWQIGKIRIPLPHLLTPGETHVIHKNVSQNKFRFTISMNHNILGETFFQTGLFSEV